MKETCKYCCRTGTSGDAWKSQPILKSQSVHFNYHEEFTAKIKDYGQLIGDGDDLGFINYVKKHPASLEIQSVIAGKKLFYPLSDIPLTIDIEIEYCPKCGRKLGITPTNVLKCEALQLGTVGKSIQGECKVENGKVVFVNQDKTSKTVWED